MRGWGGGVEGWGGGWGGGGMGGWVGGGGGGGWVVTGAGWGGGGGGSGTGSGSGHGCGDGCFRESTEEEDTLLRATGPECAQRVRRQRGHGGSGSTGSRHKKGVWRCIFVGMLVAALVGGVDAVGQDELARELMPSLMGVTMSRGMPRGHVTYQVGVTMSRDITRGHVQIRTFFLFFYSNIPPFFLCFYESTVSL